MDVTLNAQLSALGFRKRSRNNRPKQGLMFSEPVLFRLRESRFNKVADCRANGGWLLASLLNSPLSL